jgi:hypothetical protein
MLKQSYLEYVQNDVEKYGLRVSGSSVVTFCCCRCGRRWQPAWKNGRWQRGYRRCPNGCNRNMFGRASRSADGRS